MMAESYRERMPPAEATIGNLTWGAQGGRIDLRHKSERNSQVNSGLKEKKDSC